MSKCNGKVNDLNSEAAVICFLGALKQGSLAIWWPDGSHWGCTTSSLIVENSSYRVFMLNKAFLNKEQKNKLMMTI